VNATEHYKAAERLLDVAKFDIDPDNGLATTDGHLVPSMVVFDHLVARAQAHAMLALAAANGADDPPLVEALRELVDKP